MATARPIGEFSLKLITIELEAGPAGSILNKGNFEGTGTGFGAVFCTATFTGGAKDGTYGLVGVAYLENGEALSFTGQGSYETKGKHHWSVSGTSEISDGRRLSNSSEIDLAARSWKGTLSELS
ncbi:MAG TPA: hypothetical protein VEJ86_02375 [Candidatus Binataceae bacterium]|nr:hypothetical protein [Candidatus Binataceae bacterium]